MIKRIRLKNFESHEDSEIEFTDGFNLIVGQSNQGKSSIVRAISMVIANKFDKDSVRTGEDFCEVEIESEKGSILAQRGASINRWVIKFSDGTKKEYKNIGTTVPPEVIGILGMGERSHGDIKELSNIMFQFEKHYMLSEIDGKKATSNMIARMMDEAIGIGGMEELIKDMAVDFQNFKKDLNSCVSEMSVLKSEIMDEDIFNETRRSIDRLREKRDEVKEIETLLNDSKDISLKLSSIHSNINKIIPRISVISKIESLCSKLNVLEDKIIKIKKSLSLIEKIGRLEDHIEKINDLNFLFVNANNRFTQLSLFKNVLSLNEKIKKLELSKVDLSNVSAKIEKLENDMRRIEDAERMLYNARLTYRKIRRAESNSIDSLKKLEQSSKELHDLMDDLGACPLCGASLRIKSEESK